jgi:hypothetical protein
MMRNIYLDTMLWNVLHDQTVEPGTFVGRLRSKGACIAIGTHDFYEIAKNFCNPSNHDRGKTLFAYFKRYLEADTQLIRDNMELLAHEMWALRLRRSVPETALSTEDRSLIVRQAERFATDETSEESTNFLENQKSFAEGSRSGQIAFLDSRRDIKQKLQSIPADRFADWLDNEIKSPVAVAILTNHIRRRFPEAPLEAVI